MVAIYHFIIHFFIKINSGTELLFVLIRSAFIFIYAVIIFRADKRRFNLGTSFDFGLILIIGAALGSTVSGNVTLVQSVACSTLFVFLHWLFAFLSFYNSTFEKWTKGKSEILVKDGKPILKALRRNQITRCELVEICRQNTEGGKLDEVQEARLEKNGTISFKKKEKNNKKAHKKQK